MYEDQEGFINISITPEVFYRAITEYINQHILKDPVKVVSCTSFGYPPEQWSIRCATLIQRLAGGDNA